MEDEGALDLGLIFGMAEFNRQVWRIRKVDHLDAGVDLQPLPTVSRKVGELEARLGTPLLIRTTRRLSLTEAGTAYVAAVRRILEEVNEAERMAAGEFITPRGELVLTAPVLFGRLHLLPLVTEFLDAYPEIDVRLVLSDRNLHLIDDHVDIAVRISPLPDSSMIATRVGSMRTVVCASPRLLSIHGYPKTPDELAGMPCVGFDMLAARSNWVFQGRGAKAAIQVKVRPRLIISTAEAAVWAAVQGVGVTRVLHYQCAQAVSDGKLEIVLPAYEPAPLPIHLLHAERGTLPLKMRVFLDFAAPRLRERLDHLS
ncbi:LysR substrate-binding domain-containing protein [Microvirga zambiensis]|uniref:LysR substrate-binding domain-containing protein n=1 Tax=Microvirga zambiensis TaxID=1402137 RepID=UPI001FE85C79|nr:LysR substrate-binding domain-containing protein [Microvirga zambiensis]